MSTPAPDFFALRERRIPDKAFLIQNTLEGIDALNCQVSSWPYITLTATHLGAAERMLLGIQRLMRELAPHVAED